MLQIVFLSQDRFSGNHWAETMPGRLVCSPGFFSTHYCGQVNYSYKRWIGWKLHGKNGYEPENA